MRNSYQINFQPCKFYVGSYEIFHSVSDLCDLFNITPEARGVIVDQWLDKIKECPIEWGWGGEDYLIPEQCLAGFLQDVIAASPEQTIVSAESILGKIIQERLDAIVGNDTPHITHENLAVRKAMQEYSKRIYRSIYTYMDYLQRVNLFSPEQDAEWSRIKRIIPDSSGAINDRHLVALLMLIAPIYPDINSINLPIIVRSMTLGHQQFLYLCRKDRVSRTKKALLVQETLYRFGLLHANKNHMGDQPEP